MNSRGHEIVKILLERAAKQRLSYSEFADMDDTTYARLSSVSKATFVTHGGRGMRNAYASTKTDDADVVVQCLCLRNHPQGRYECAPLRVDLARPDTISVV